ncbi:hypothetical protein LOAG_12349 [Loa loa]|uniref:Uncharacterized protein n=1 Tax=Loa loa TaxID=7209 RepID=A0A1S0TMV4_LOALO|nr:hypothetical protein LOAG_12349 [Loa loa]EFO16160.1 hypothetical protein LOAG_12349 [Loa loa]
MGTCIGQRPAYLTKPNTAKERSGKTQTDSELELVKTQDNLPLLSNKTIERLPEKARYFPKILLEIRAVMKQATTNLTDSADQSSTPATFTKTNISPSSSHEREISRNNSESRLRTDLGGKNTDTRNTTL